MPPIFKKGRFLQTDAEGFLINESKTENLRPPWQEVVEEIKQVYLRHLGDRIHSIYLRGSLPRNEAVAGVSDVDSFAVVLGNTKSLDLSWIGPCKSELLKKYPFVTDVEFVFFPYETLLNSPADLTHRFIIKTLSVCLHGADLSPKISRFKPELTLAYAFHGQIQRDVELAKKGFREIQNPHQIRQGCTWIMKRLLRTGFSLFMQQEKTYTRDLYLCYEVFSKHYPEHQSEIRQALEWAVHPTEDPSTLLAFLENFGTWVEQAAQTRFFPRQGGLT